MEKIPNTIQIYLSEIAERLSQGRATVMVGAGFSKNAIKIKNTDKKFLSWNELGDLFYEKLNGKKPDEETGHYMDALRLAGNIECTFGRSTLDRILLDYLPDDEYEPSDLHKELLRLNWKDVFTTNYDTLLERTRKYISNRKYQVVVNKDDLVYLGCPRIIKLHGSFPSQRPFVISQEDYRKYPKDSAAFVNTVQQALLENIMCLIGFSGDDPNFLNWIGWIKDNLGESMSKIYLITVDLSPRIDNALLESRNIVIINMVECLSEQDRQDIGNLYKNALSVFFREIGKCKLDREGKWNPKSKSIDKIIESSDVKKISEETKVDVKQCSDLWKESKIDYPGWIIMPYKYRCRFEASLDSFELYLEICYNIMKESDGTSFLDFLKVYDWVRKACLLPLTDYMASIYIEFIHGEYNDINGIIDLTLSVMEYYRYNGIFDKHSEIMGNLEKYTVSDEHNARIECEQAYSALYQLDFDMLEQMLDRPFDILNYDMELMRIGLMWECDRNKQAADRLSDTLDKVRCSDNSKVNIKLLSQEAYIINLFGIMTHMEVYTPCNSIGKEDIATTAERVFSNYESQCYGLGNRRDFLKLYECDPESERAFLDIALMSLKDAETDEETAYIKSVQFINYIERSGMCMVKDTWNDYSQQIEIAIKNIVKKNLYWGIVLSVRTRDIKLIHDILTDQVVITYSTEVVEKIVENLFNRLQEYCDNIHPGIKINAMSYKYMVYESLIPHVLSILIWYISKKKRHELFQWLICNASICRWIKDIKILIDELFASFNLEEIEKYFCDILNYELKSEVKELSQCITKCSISLYEKEPLYSDNKYSELKELLFFILKKNTDEKGIINITYRIAILYHVGCLDANETAILKESVYKVLRSKEVCSLDLYYFVADLFPQENEIKKIIRERVLNELHNCIQESIKDRSNTKLTECFYILRKIELIYKVYNLVWDKNAVQYISDSIESHQEYSADFYLFSQMLVNVICESDLSKTERVLIYEKKLEKYGLKCNKESEGINYNYILEGLLGKNTTIFVEALSLFYVLLRDETNIWINYVDQILFILCMTVKSYLPPAAFCVDMIRKIIKINTSVGVILQVDLHLIADLLKDILVRPIFSDEMLLVKASAAKLSYDLSLLKWDDEYMVKIIESWETECKEKDIPMLIKKQWYDITNI